MTAGYIDHSKDISEAKDKGSLVGQYLLSKADKKHITLLPESIFLEQERIFYPYYYFYFGKTKKGNRFTVDISSFDRLNEIEEYFINSPLSTQPTETTNITAKPLYFFYDNSFPELQFLLYHKNDNEPIDTIIYRQQKDN
ncbi:MAG: hypothetical protein GXC73_08545 [Chitinophagaceae bacterium]|nr:hypothetical protein [Chitinophagaceae bacterium]